MSANDNDIDALLEYLGLIAIPEAPRYHRALAALVAERNALQAKISAHAEDRRKYIDAWEGWIASTKRLGIAEWLRVYADAVPIPSLDGDEAKERVFKHLDQRMRDAAETIDELRKRIAELESQSPATSDLRERDEAMTRWMDQVTAMLCHSMTHSHDAKQELVARCDKAIDAMRKENTNA